MITFYYMGIKAATVGLNQHQRQSMRQSSDCVKKKSYYLTSLVQCHIIFHATVLVNFLITNVPVLNSKYAAWHLKVLSDCMNRRIFELDIYFPKQGSLKGSSKIYNRGCRHWKCRTSWLWLVWCVPGLFRRSECTWGWTKKEPARPVQMVSTSFGSWWAPSKNW